MICNRAKLAEFIGVSTPTIDAIVKAGAPYITRPGPNGSQWEFESGRVLDWMVQQRRATNPIGYQLKAAQAREAEARASLRQMEMHERLKQVVPVDDLLEIVDEAFTLVRHHLSAPFDENLAAKLAAEPDANACLLLLKTAVNDALEAASSAAADLAETDAPAKTSDT